MLTGKSRLEMAQDAYTLASSFEMVVHNSVLYIPADFESFDSVVIPEVERRIWLPLSRSDLRIRAAEQFKTLFNTETELVNFDFMVRQCSIQSKTDATSMLIRTPEGLKELREDGKLYVPTGSFVPNYLSAMLNTDEADKAEVMSVLVEWLDSEEEAVALLRHLATALAPGWSAVKYVLLIGDGRNGKSVLLSMMKHLFTPMNVSAVSRQDISEKKPVVTELNGKLINIVFDGVAEFLKDSGNEKTLVAGEPLGVRKLYSSELTTVQTNALFVEGLNREPKSSDKSSALQARLVRFLFPKTYPEDLAFRDRMLSDRMLGAFLALLIDNYVKKEDKAVMLAPTQGSLALQMEHMTANSMAIQFLLHLEENDPLGAEVLLGQDMSELVQRFRSWRLKEDDISPWNEASIKEMFQPLVLTERKGKSVNGRSVKVRVVSTFKKEAAMIIASKRGDLHELVGD